MANHGDAMGQLQPCRAGDHRTVLDGAVLELFQIFRRLGRRIGVETAYLVQFPADADDQNAANRQSGEKNCEYRHRELGTVGGQHHVDKAMDIGNG